MGVALQTMHYLMWVETNRLGVSLQWCDFLWDWSFIMGREGGGYKRGESRVRNILHPPPQDRVKHFSPPPPFYSGIFLRPLQNG